MIQALKKLFIVSTILILLGYVGNLMLDNPYIHRLMRELMNENLKEYTKLNVKFEAIGAKFFPPGIDVYGVEVKSQQADSRSLFRASHIKLNISIIAVLLSRKEIFDLEFNEPVVELPLPPLEELLRMEKFPELLEPDDSLPAWPPESQHPFYRIAVTNAKLAVNIKEGDKQVFGLHSEGLNFEFVYHSWKDFSLEADAQRNQLILDEVPVLRDLSLRAKLQSKGSRVESELVEISSPEIRSTGHWNIGFELIPRKAQEPSRLRGLTIRLNHQIPNADIAILGRFLNTGETAGAVSGSSLVQLHIPFDTRPLTWEVQGSAASHGATLAGFKLLDSTADFTLREDGITFTKGLVKKAEQILLKGDGSLSFKNEGALAFKLQPQGISIKDLLSALQVEDFEAFETSLGPTEIDLTGQTSPFQLKVAGDVLLEQLTFPFVKNLPERHLEAPTCKLSAELSIDANEVKIVRGNGPCYLRDAESNVSLNGRFTYSTQEGMNLKIQSHDLQGSLLDHYTKMESEGIIDAGIDIKGPYDNLVIAGKVESYDLDFSGFQMSNLNARFRLPINKNVFEIQSFEANIGSEGTLLIEDASIGLEADLPFKAKIEAKKIPPTFLASGLQRSSGNNILSMGIRSFEGHLIGPLLKPFQYTGKAHFSIQDLIWDNEKLLSEVTGTFSGDKDKRSLDGVYLKLDRLDAKLDLSIRSRKGGQKLTGLENLGLESDSLFKINFHTIDKGQGRYRSNVINEAENHLTSLPFVGTFFAEHGFGGVIGLTTELEGTLHELQGKIEGTIERPFIWGVPIPSLSFSGFVDGMHLQIPELRHAGNSLLGRLNIDFSKPGIPYDWYIYLNQFDIRAVLGKFFADDPRNFAYLSAEWTLAGTFRDFWKSRGELVFNQLRSKLFRNLGSRTSAIELNSDQAIRIKIGPDGWVFDDKRSLKLQGDFFDLELSTGENRLPDDLDLNLKGSMKLDILKNFSSIIETARGEVVFDGYLRGSISNPEFSMRIRERKLDPFNLKEWNPVSLGVVNYGPPLTGINLDVEVKNDRLVVHRFKASKGREGGIEVVGDLLFHENGNEVSRMMINLKQIEFNRLPVPVLKTADLIISGDLTVSGNSFPFNLDGNLKVDRFQSVGSFDLRREIVSSLYDSKLSSAAISGPGQSPLLNLDIGIQADRSIIVKNKSLEGTLSANLRVKGTDVKPLLLGQVIADQGTFNYRRTFKVTQAVISFDEPVSPPNPRLDISGEAIINPYKVTVQITGDAANPKVNLTADPPSRDDGSPITNLDIVLLITTGKIPESANKTAEKASVNEIFSNFLVFAEEPLEKLFDRSGQTVIREVYIDSYISETEQRPVTRLNVPFSVFSSANAVVQVDDESNAKLSFEYPLHEGITFSGSLDKKANQKDETANNLPADTGFDLKFRFGFD